MNREPALAAARKQHDPAEPEARSDDGTHLPTPQCFPAMPSSAPHGSIAPTVTTSVPAGGPELNVTRSPSTCVTVTAERT